MITFGEKLEKPVCLITLDETMAFGVKAPFFVLLGLVVMDAIFYF